MKTTLGGERLGSGNKQVYSGRNYERSTHDLGYIWRSSMSAGTLVPFMNYIGLPGDSMDIDLSCEVLTLPTIGPLFGSFKVQLDVFTIPVRLYNASLHMNRVNIGNNMQDVPLPQFRVYVNDTADWIEQNNRYADDAQINPSCLWAYLGVRGIGINSGSNGTRTRTFNAVGLLAYWDIYKNYYANKQEERGFAIHVDNNNLYANNAIVQAYVKLLSDDSITGNAIDNTVSVNETTMYLQLYFGGNAVEPDPEKIQLLVGGAPTTIAGRFNQYDWDDNLKILTCQDVTGGNTSTTWNVPEQNVAPINAGPISPQIVEFPLTNIDDMRFKVLQHTPQTSPFIITNAADAPYSFPSQFTGSVDADKKYSCLYSQEGLGLKTYQSDLFNNWIDTEWIDGTNGINEVTSVDTTGDAFTIDALNLASKVYYMLNRIAMSGGSYDDWLDAVYSHKRSRGIEDPVYMGSLIKELAFEEVVSNADASDGRGFEQPLGTLAGRGRLTGKNKGGRIKIKIDEPSYVMGLVSLTPRIDYSQGNDWFVNLKTMDDFHKPALDAIGFQDLVTEQMAWQSTDISANDVFTQRSAGKQPAWINYMTAVNKTYGNFALENQEMFMTLNRRYEIDEATGAISDLTTYIDPTKFNHIFAETNLDAQNFWVQIGVKNIARRKMSAKVIPNL